MNFNSFLNKCISFLFVFLLFLSIFIGSFFFNPFVFAESDSYFPLPIISSSSSYSDFYNNSLKITSFSGDSSYYGVAVSVYSSLDLFAFRVDDKVYICGDADSVSSSSRFYYIIPYNSSILSDRISFYDSSSNLNYGSISLVNLDSSTFLFPSVESLSSGLSAVRSFIDNGSWPSSPSLTYENTVTIEPGYILFAVTEGGSVDLTCTMPVNNSLNVVGIPWDSTSRIAFGVDRPTDGTTYTVDNFGSRINWGKMSGAPTNFLGLTKYAFAHYDDLPSNGSFVAIMNPAYYGDSVVDPSINSPIYATFSAGGAYVKYSMNTQLTLGVGGIMNPVITSDTGWTDYAIAIPETNGAVTTTDYVWNSTSASAVEFPDGGQNDLSQSNNDVQGIGGLIGRIINLLSAPITHIQNLFNSGSTFMVWLSSLWGWMPEPVTAVLTSALIVLIVVGVIKFLWK